MLKQVAERKEDLGDFIGRERINLIFIFSLLGFFMIYFMIFAIRAITDKRHQGNFMIYTVLASFCGGAALFLVLLAIL